jgi:hypothetical protein
MTDENKVRDYRLDVSGFLVVGAEIVSLSHIQTGPGSVDLASYAWGGGGVPSVDQMTRSRMHGALLSRLRFVVIAQYLGT